MRRPGLLLSAMVFACGAFASPLGAQMAPANPRMPCHNATEIAKQLSTTPAGMSCIVAAGKRWESLPIIKSDPMA